MTEEKAKKLIVASTVGAVLLAFVLMFVMIWQMCKITNEKNKIAYYNAKIAECNRLIEAEEDNRSAIMTKQKLISEAHKLGYIFDGDIIIG